jgi:hypothetical protein
VEEKEGEGKGREEGEKREVGVTGKNRRGVWRRRRR